MIRSKKGFSIWLSVIISFEIITVRNLQLIVLVLYLKMMGRENCEARVFVREIINKHSTCSSLLLFRVFSRQVLGIVTLDLVLQGYIEQLILFLFVRFPSIIFIS